MTGDTASYDSLEIQSDGAVATIRLTRPELLNRFDDTLHTEITEVLRNLARDREVRAIVLSSTGRIFSAGGDLELTRQCHADVALCRRVIDDGKKILQALFDTPQPLVAAVQGDVVGIPTTIVLGCDAVVAARHVRFMDPHVNIGIAAGDGGAIMWPLSAGLIRAKRHLLTGDPLLAEDAFTLGVVTDLVDTAEEVVPAASALAARIAALPPLAVQGTKHVLNNLMRARAAEVLELGFMHSLATLQSQDLVEAVDAFTERRPGRYQGT